MDNLKKNPLVLINDKNQIYIKIRLSTGSLIEGYEIKQEIEKLGCQVVEVHSGYKKFVELNTWTYFESLLEIAKIENVAVIGSFTPIQFR